MDASVLMAALVMGALAGQIPATCILCARLLPGAWRRPPLEPEAASPEQLGQVSVVVPTLNEGDRIGPCLAGLAGQGYPLREILVVDSHSRDSTPDQVKAAEAVDPRFRLLQDPPLPPDWIGRPWALHWGFLQSSPQSRWILYIDADTEPQRGLVASLVRAATVAEIDMVSLSPRFILISPGEIWLQPALLMTLIYRFGASGSTAVAGQMANGQCLLMRRSLLAALGGHTVARRSFCDDVTLVRHAARQGAKVAFWDGAKLLRVRMYKGARQTWQEWGRSLDLKDAATPAQTWAEVLFLLATQGLPLPLLLLLAGSGQRGLTFTLAMGLNAGLLLIRLALGVAVRPSYDLSNARGAWLFWLSPLADGLAVLRIALSAAKRPRQWRGRQYFL